MEVRQPNTLGVELVEMRRLDDRVAMAGEIAVALVVGHHEDDVGFVVRGRGRSQLPKKGEYEENRRVRADPDRHFFHGLIITSCEIHGAGPAGSFACQPLRELGQGHAKPRQQGTP